MPLLALDFVRIKNNYYFITNLNFNFILTITLHTTYFKDSSENRNIEVYKAININLNLRIVTKVYVYTESVFPLAHPKLKIISIESRPNFSKLSSNFDANGINIICNSDISFSNDLKNLVYLFDTKKKAFFISRRLGLFFFKKYIVFKHNVGNSQDAWAFYGVIPYVDDLIKKLDKIQIGVPGNDNALVHVFRSFNFTVINPSYLIALSHHHKTEKRNYTNYDRLALDYDYVQPTITSRFHLCERFVQIINLLYYRRWFR